MRQLAPSCVNRCPNHPASPRPPVPSCLAPPQHSHDPATSLCILLLSSISLSVGASVGPEAALGSTGAAMGTVIGNWVTGKWMPTPALVQGEEAHGLVTGGERWRGDRRYVNMLYVIVGLSATIGPLLPSPILTVMLLHEVAFAARSPAWATHEGTGFMETMTLSGLAAAASFAFFIEFKSYTFLGAGFSLPPAALIVKGTQVGLCNWPPAPLRLSRLSRCLSRLSRCLSRLHTCHTCYACHACYACHTCHACRACLRALRFPRARTTLATRCRWAWAAACSAL